MSHVHRTFTKEFKVEAIRLLESSGKSMAQLAADLGIAESNVYRWKLQFGQHGQHAFPGSGHQLPHV